MSDHDPLESFAPSSAQESTIFSGSRLPATNINIEPDSISDSQKSDMRPVASMLNFNLNADTGETACTNSEEPVLEGSQSFLKHIPSYLLPLPPPPRISKLKRLRARKQLCAATDISPAPPYVEMEDGNLQSMPNKKSKRCVHTVTEASSSISSDLQQSDYCIHVSLSYLEKLINEKWEAEEAKCRAQRALEISQLRSKVQPDCCTSLV